MTHYASMEDYNEFICEDSGEHTWNELFSHADCIYCEASRCTHRDIVYGVSHRCEAAQMDGGQYGGCAEHERLNTQESARDLVLLMAKEETTAHRRETFGLMLRDVATLMLGTDAVGDVEQAHRSGAEMRTA